MSHRFLQLHFLTSYPASLLNRDDAGFAKRIPFGGAVRTRISSQCLKRHWRTFDGEHALSQLEVPETIRSRHTFEKFIVQPLVKEGVTESLARDVTEGLMAALLGKSVKATKKSRKNEEEVDSAPLQTGQVTVLGRPEVDYLLGLAREICAAKPEAKAIGKAVDEKLGKPGRENLQALRHASGLGAALFGRMVTSDILARGDAAVHVAHAFTVHGEAAESDYFSAVDDLLQDEDSEGGLGSGHIGTTELTSGLFYGYVVVDLPLLVSNLEGCDRKEWRTTDRTLASKVTERLVHLVATVSPGAKLGSTAPYAYAHLVMAELGNSQPRTLANAFLKPVGERGDLAANTNTALGSYVEELDAMYGKSTERRMVGIGNLGDFVAKTQATKDSGLQSLANWVAAGVRA